MGQLERALEDEPPADDSFSDTENNRVDLAELEAFAGVQEGWKACGGSVLVQRGRGGPLPGAARAVRPVGGQAAQPDMGANASGLAWPDELVDALARKHRVIRYDHRDTGASTWAFDRVPYSATRMAEDVLAILDALGIERAHVASRAAAQRDGHQGSRARSRPSARGAPEPLRDCGSPLSMSDSTPAASMS